MAPPAFTSMAAGLHRHLMLGQQSKARSALGKLSRPAQWHRLAVLVYAISWGSVFFRSADQIAVTAAEVAGGEAVSPSDGHLPARSRIRVGFDGTSMDIDDYRLRLVSRKLVEFPADGGTT